jgi:exodeoxyribonuclease V alpha subunit
MLRTPPKTSRPSCWVVTERLPQRFGLHPIRDVQVLAPMNHGSLGARALNAVL